MLTESQIEAYQQRGYVTPSYRVPNELLAEIKEAHARLIAKHPDVSDYCSALLAFDPWFLNVARQPDILDMVGQVLGEDFALWNCSFFAKPARVGSKTPWHQDGEYWPIDPLATCTVWIAVDDSTQENGCLRVIPGSHLDKRLAKHDENNAPGLALNLELSADEFDESAAEDIVLQAGQVSLHDVYLYHGSEANQSDNSRRGMTLRYMPMTSVYRHDSRTRFARQGVLEMSQRTVYLMRGADQTGENDFRVRY
jgi:ectoine hydroxylase-related dioxygenase (phytanoyl-CoA dioxygenase family)